MTSAKIETHTQNSTCNGEEFLSAIPNSLAVSRRDLAALWVVPASIIILPNQIWQLLCGPAHKINVTNFARRQCHYLFNESARWDESIDVAQLISWMTTPL